MIYAIRFFGIVALLAFSSCAKKSDTPDLDLLKSSLARSAPTGVPQTDVAALVSGNNAFALDLYRQVAASGSNVFCSPYSISLALAMTWAGAKGETANEIARAMRFTLTQERLHPAFNSLDQTIESRGSSENPSGLKLCIADALWGQKGYPFLSGFLDVLAQNYGAGLNLLDFRDHAEQSRQTINSWVSSATGNRINDLLPAGTVSPDTRLVLTNAIYFKGAWADSFHRSDTRDTLFTLQDGSTVVKPLMFQQNHFRYATGADFQAVELPYLGDQVSMVVLLPARGAFSSFESRLDTTLLDSICTALASATVNVHLPRFTFTSGSISLRSALCAMGMPIAFSDSADFTGMANSGLSIGDVVHKAFIAVDEYGTEAAAATGVTMDSTAAPFPGQPVEFRADRPFIFAIRDNATGAILFLGRVMN